MNLVNTKNKYISLLLFIILVIFLRNEIQYFKVCVDNYDLEYENEEIQFPIDCKRKETTTKPVITTTNKVNTTKQALKDNVQIILKESASNISKYILNLNDNFSFQKTKERITIQDYDELYNDKLRGIEYYNPTIKITKNLDKDLFLVFKIEKLKGNNHIFKIKDESNTEKFPFNKEENENIKTLTYRFSEIGNFIYYCNIHSSMRGTINITN
jgi:hypothetical protein